MFIDTHAHINDERLDTKTIINNMQQDELDLIFNVSYNMLTAKETLKLAVENENVFAILGIHPSEENDFSDANLIELENMCKSKKVVAVGEIGLDYHYEGFDKQKQADFFVKQIKLADKLHLPIVVHLRDAYLDFENLILKHKTLIKNGMLMHCYSGSKEFAENLIKEIPNTYFAFGGAITFKNARSILEACQIIPLNRILTETDCPYLTPEPFRGKTANEPKYVKYIAAKIADIKGISIQKLCEFVKENTATFFKI